MKVAAWNVARGLSDPARFETVAEGVRELDADIVVVSEAFDRSGQAVRPDYAEALGYRAFEIGYDDAEAHPSGQQYLAVMSRVACSAAGVRLGCRNGLAVSAGIGRTGRRLELYAVHADDRDESKRLLMARTLLTAANDVQYGSLGSDIVPDVVIAGDLNNMPAGQMTARLLRSSPARTLAGMIPHQRYRSLAVRLADMARGEALSELELAGFRNANQMGEATMRQAGLSVTLDHILQRGPGAASDFVVHDIPGSDHRAISAIVG